jgi:Family of unknown function (DUF6157)
MATKIFNTFVSVADDCPAGKSVVPPSRTGAETIATIQYRLLMEKPFRYTLEDLIFEVHLARMRITSEERAERGEKIRARLFSRPHACMRASPLTKSYGWGAHYDEKGRLAIVARESKDYSRLASSADLTVVKAMRNRRV